MHESRIDFVERTCIDAEALRDTRPEAFDDDIRAFGKSSDYGTPAC